VTTRLSVDRLHKRFGQIEALRAATFRVEPGEVLGLLGPNGAGKSTLLACLAGLLLADGGDVRGDDGLKIAIARRHDTLMYLPDGIAPWPEQTADWILAFWRVMAGARTDGWDAIADVLGLAELRGRRLGTLSKGERKRVLLGLSLASPQPVVLMDEPFDGLDLRQTRATIAMFRELAAAGRSLVLSIHSMPDAARVCDRLVLLNDGSTIAEGTLGQLRERTGLSAVADLEDVFLALA
jgi:ABC-type multidrug transport system ATPase subunit